MSSNKESKFFLMKLFSFNSIGVTIRTLSGLIAQKFIAVYIGPSGLAILGNLRNLLGITSLFSTMGIDQGVLTLESKFAGDSQSLRKLYKTSNLFALIGSLLTSLVLIIFRSEIGFYVFGTNKYSYLLIVFALSIPFTALYNLGLSIKSGRSDYKSVTFLSLVVHVSISILLIVLVTNYNLEGALWALILTPIVQLIFIALIAWSTIINLLSSALGLVHSVSKELVLFIIMAFSAVIISNVVDLTLRNHLILELSIEDGGYWTSMGSISNYYLSVLTGFYSLYVLPKYARVQTFLEFRLEVVRIYKFVLPIFLVLFVLLYLSRYVLIALLYSEDFLPMEVLFKWQLAGDFIKITAVVIAYNLIAKKMWKLFIVTELFSSLLFYGLGMYLINRIGLEGIVLAHLFRYLLYLIVIIATANQAFKSNHSH